MHHKTSIYLGALLTSLGVLARAETPPAPPIEAFASLPAMTMVSMSPNGRKLAWVKDAGGTPRIIIFDLATGMDQRQVDIGQFTIRGLEWADSRTLLITVDVHRVRKDVPGTDGLLYTRTLAVDAELGNVQALLLGDPEDSEVLGAAMVRVRTSKPDTVLMSTWQYEEFDAAGRRLGVIPRVEDAGWRHSLFEVNTRTGAVETVEWGTPFTTVWLADAQGRAVARSEWNPQWNGFAILVKRGGAWERVYESQGGMEFGLQAISADGKTIYATGARGGNRVRLWQIPVDGSEISIAFENPERDIISTLNNEFTGALTGYRLGGTQTSTVWVDPGMATMQQRISRAFPDGRASIIDHSENQERVLVYADRALGPPIYYLIDSKKGTADVVGETYPLLADVELGKLESTRYRSGNSVEIPAYLTLPPSRAPANLPLVVLMQGGLQSRDHLGFHWFAQFLATRGYAVLQPQFRGAAGFGSSLPHANERQWGRALQDDLTDGVRHLVAKGMVDPKRVCIVGGSFGGYAALAGAAFTSDIYACAVSFNGVSDLPDFMTHIQSQYDEDPAAFNYWTQIIGKPSANDLARYSPARSVDSIRAPILLLHGKSDTEVPFAQSENFAKLLKEQGKTVELVELPGNDHELAQAASRAQVLQAVDDFLATHLRP